MNLKYPKKSGLRWSSKIRNKHFGLVFMELFLYYLAVNLVFSAAYFAFGALKNAASFIDYVYFSFVTSLSIGYGDVVPLNTAGKLLVIIQSSITAVYFALMVSVLSVKMFYPRDLVKFSKKIIYNPSTDMLIIRAINTSREALVNPDIRISITEHNTGCNSAGMFDIPIDYRLTYLGKYDFSYTFKNSHKNLNVMNEAELAKKYNKHSNTVKSRFRINISLTGSYGFSQTAIYKKYYADDLHVGKAFKPITYNKEFCGIKGNVRYNKSKDFWTDFEETED